MSRFSWRSLVSLAVTVATAVYEWVMRRRRPPKPPVPPTPPDGGVPLAA